MSAQNRTPPAFQEYAAAMMSRIEYRVLTLPQRGLLYSMRLECWVNNFLPESPEMLARVLGYDPKEVAAELPYVMPFFACKNGRITSPELDDYRAYLDHVRERKSQGGKRGADVTNSAKTQKRRGSSAVPPSNPSGMSSGMPPGHPRVLSTVQPSTAQPRNEVLGDRYTEVVGTGWKGFSDFTQDPEQEVEQ
ncbi:hypothetical protein [Thauera sp. WB-2]|uniref:hypothetical protein n=1 Tax=Thauera sp. WB-2 TaxID=2897772 RepID=UPI0022DCEC3C|nr:hypothetical protein [Thauera sp. WB-2]WBL64699.1 hypothetical protein LQF09_02410 [Thauera sp. WB-2]